MASAQVKIQDLKNGMDNNDVVAARRRALQEAIHSGETVMVSPTGQVQLPGESDDPTRPGISVPQGKLA